MQAEKFTTVEAYFASVPKETRDMLKELRAVIKAAAPKAEETIGYNMPAFKFNGPLVYYAAYKNHIGFYPTASPMIVFKDELSAYKTSKGAIQFPLDKAIPKMLVKKIVQYRVKENLEKAALKTLKRK